MLKLGAVPFLNVGPLIFPLEEGLVKHEYEILYETPSNLSGLLKEKKVDLGLIPVAELLKNHEYKVVPNISISSDGRVGSVVLLTKNTIKKLHTVAIDIRSKSSTALLKIILEIFNKKSPTYVYRNPDKEFLNGVDGGMLIGNAGLTISTSPPNGYRVIDLGDLWTNETGLPFVYAVYSVSDGVTLGKNLQALEMAKVMGLKHVRKIARIQSEKIGLSEDICLRYLTESIHYDLGEREFEGIKTFRDYLSKIEENELIEDINFYSE